MSVDKVKKSQRTKKSQGTKNTERGKKKLQWNKINNQH